MAKLTLELEESYDFQLIGISCHVKDYRISWEINQHLNFDLIKDESLSLHIKEEEQRFTFFSYWQEDEFAEYYLIGNRSDNGTLIPEESTADYFMLIKGHVSSQEVKSLAEKINKLKPVLTAYVIEVDNLKSKANLVF
ncbi:MAG: IPExxxVDY family protein [Vicingaceae bacterium]